MPQSIGKSGPSKTTYANPRVFGKIAITNLHCCGFIPLLSERLWHPREGLLEDSKLKRDFLRRGALVEARMQLLHAPRQAFLHPLVQSGKCLLQLSTKDELV